MARECCLSVWRWKASWAAQEAFMFITDREMVFRIFKHAQRATFWFESSFILFYYTGFSFFLNLFQWNSLDWGHTWNLLYTVFLLYQVYQRVSWENFILRKRLEWLIVWPFYVSVLWQLCTLVGKTLFISERVVCFLSWDIEMKYVHFSKLFSEGTHVSRDVFTYLKEEWSGKPLSCTFLLL